MSKQIITAVMTNDGCFAEYRALKAAVCHVVVTYGVSMLFLQWVMERGGSERQEETEKSETAIKDEFCLCIIITAGGVCLTCL